MAIRQIRTEGDPVLASISKPVKVITDHILEILDDMIETMHMANGVGLAAPQIGILRRMVVVEVDDRLYELINPVITEQSGEQFDSEGCLSVPGMAGDVSRPMTVTVKALNRNGEEVSYTGTGLLARAFCHELDHLDGILYTSKTKNLHRLDEEGEDE